jgi:hypothetical protein
MKWGRVKIVNESFFIFLSKKICPYMCVCLFNVFLFSDLSEEKKANGSFNIMWSNRQQPIAVLTCFRALYIIKQIIFLKKKKRKEKRSFCSIEENSSSVINIIKFSFGVVARFCLAGRTIVGLYIDWERVRHRKK